MTRAGQMRVSKVSGPVVGNYLFAHLGLFAVLPVLPVLLERYSGGSQAAFVGFALFVFTFCIRGASLFFAGLLHRTPIRLAVTGGLLVAALSFALMTVVQAPAGVLVLLMIAGAGISANGLMTRVFIAMSLPGAADRNTVFSAMQIAVNVAAALGPIAANLLVSDGRERGLLLIVSGMHCLAAVVVMLTIPKHLVPSDGDVRPPLRLGLVRDMAQNPDVRRVSYVSALGMFLYAQLFSALVLHVATVTDSPLLRASFFTTNAVVIVATQVPVALMVKRRLDNGSTPLALMVGGIAAFGVSFLALGGLGFLVVGTFIGVIVFSLAETLFTPIVNTAFSELPGGRPLVEVFNMRQVAVTLGESAGSFVGGALFLLAAEHGLPWAYWMMLAAVAATSAAAFRTRFRDQMYVPTSPHTTTG